MVMTILSSLLAIYFYQVVIGSLGSSLGAVTNLWQWNLCLALTRYFWNRWCADHFFKLPKWYLTEELQGCRHRCVASYFHEVVLGGILSCILAKMELTQLSLSEQWQMSLNNSLLKSLLVSVTLFAVVCD